MTEKSFTWSDLEEVERLLNDREISQFSESQNEVPGRYWKEYESKARFFVRRC